jgi:DNA-binding MarR family transcriptional regulator
MLRWGLRGGHQRELWRSDLLMHQELLARLRDALANEAGVSAADFGVLLYLAQEPNGVLRARDLATKINFERSRLSHHLMRMEQRGLIVREECEEDARGLMVRSTPAGRRAFEAAAPVDAEVVQDYFLELLTKQEFETLRDVFDRVLDKLGTNPR